MGKAGQLTIVFVGIAVAIVVGVCQYGLDPSLTDLEVGDCVEWPSGGFGEIEKLEHVDCSEPHALRVVAVFDVTGYGGWPGQAAINVQADQRCPWETSYVLGPTKDSWHQAGGRRIVCFEEAR